jgi:hypothetical protein
MPRLLTGIADIVWQAKNWRRIFGLGCHRPTPGRTITLPASYARGGLRHGSFRATRSQNGDGPRPRVPFYGCMGNVSERPDYTLFQRPKFYPFRSGCWKERTLVCETFDIADSSLSFWPAPQLSRTSMPGGKRGLRHWPSFTAISGKIKRRTCADFFRRSWSNFVISPTPTVMCFPSSTPNMPMVRVIPATMHLQDV